MKGILECLKSTDGFVYVSKPSVLLIKPVAYRIKVVVRLRQLFVKEREREE